MPIVESVAATPDSESYENFLRKDAERLLDEAFEKVKADRREHSTAELAMPALFSPVHEHSAARPIIGGTAVYQQLWRSVAGTAETDDEPQEPAPTIHEPSREP
ncbi:hypothetical protein DIPPA_33930 [Diplonema papillatum]|nr:hypothetical protein DIPPA_33930 [Diplonema papillatum]|eukprot:gene12064-18640_t